MEATGGKGGWNSASMAAEIYDTDRFAELYYGSRNPPTPNLGLAARYLISLFQRWSIPFAFLGGWAVYLRGGWRQTQDVDVAVACSMEDLKTVMMLEPRYVTATADRDKYPDGGVPSIRIPQIHGTTSIQIFIFTGGRWDSDFANVTEYTVSIDIIINGFLGTPPDIPNGTELLQPVPDTTQGAEIVPVINLYYQFTSKLQAHYDRRNSGATNDYTDLVFLIGRYTADIWALRHLLGEEQRRMFYYDYSTKQSLADTEYMAQILGLSEGNNIVF